MKIARKGAMLKATAAPGPERGTHVVRGGDARALQSALERQVEIRRVDADEKPGPCLDQPAPELAVNRANLQIVPEDLDVTAHRQLLHGKPRLEALCLHLRPADADEAKARNALAQGADEVSADGMTSKATCACCGCTKALPRSSSSSSEST